MKTSICESIGDYAFTWTSIKEIEFPDSLTAIGEGAFSYTDITSITIPENVTTMEAYAFKDCSNLTEINYNATNINSSDDNGRFFISRTVGNDVVLNIGKNVEIIPMGMFSKTYDVGGSTAIELAEVNFESGSVCSEIGASAFYRCIVSEITLPDSVKTIGSYAFYFSELKTVTLGKGVVTIGDFAFSGCETLSEININATNLEDFANDNSVFDRVGFNTGGCTVNFDKDVTRVPAYFAWSSETPVTYHISIINFEDNSKCVSIGTRAFCDVDGLVVNFGSNSSLKTIGGRAFGDITSFTSIEIPASVTTIGEYAFTNCEDLESVVFPEDSKLQTIGTYAFNNCGSLTSITIPANVATICDYAFYECDSLVRIDVPDSVISLGGHAFADCGSLTTVTIGIGVTSIGYYAFTDCAYLTSVTFAVTEGWTASSTSLSSSDLANVSTAAKYLKTTYDDSKWTRS